jgi:hypothetical protein
VCRRREEGDPSPMAIAGKIGVAPWHGFPPGIAMTAPAPGRGRGRSAQRGRGGGCRKSAYEYLLRGGGNPLPCPLPHGDSHHGPLPGEVPGENRVRARSPSGASGKPAR